MTITGLEFKNSVGIDTFNCFKKVCIIGRNTNECSRLDPAPKQPQNIVVKKGSKATYKVHQKEDPRVPEKAERRSKAREVLVARTMFDLEVFRMRDRVLMFSKAAHRNRNQMGEVWQICHQSDVGGHRWLEGTMNKFLLGFFMLSASQKICFLNGGCDTCLTKEQSMPVRAREHVPSLTGYVGEKLYVDLVSMSKTIRGNRNILTTEDSFSRYCRAYSIPNKEVNTVATGQGTDESTLQGQWVT